MEKNFFKKMDKVWLVFAPIFVVLLAADQITKAWAVENLKPCRSADFGFDLAYNEGVAFGIPIPTWLIFVLTCFFLAGAIYFVVQEKLWRDKWHLAALALLFSGGIGNLIDRVRFGYVVDFLKVYWWPNFNLADIFIVAAVLMLSVSLLKEPSLTD
jgi:signal peptidase II